MEMHMSSRKRIYVAGAINAPSAGKYLNNIRKGIQLSSKIFLLGYAPFCPFIDFHYNLVMSDVEVESIKTQDFYDYSMAWLDKADAILVVPGWEKSVGTKLELERAKANKIPIFYSTRDLILTLPPESE